MKAVEQADSFLGLGGQLVGYCKDKPIECQTKREMSDSKWEYFLNEKSEGRKWQRWNAETTQGRWNVIVYYAEGKEALSVKTERMPDLHLRRKIWDLVGPASFKMGLTIEELLELGPEDQVVRMLMSLVKKPTSDHDYGITNAMALAVALSDFAERGNKKAVGIFVDIAKGLTCLDYDIVQKGGDLDKFVHLRAEYFYDKR